MQVILIRHAEAVDETLALRDPHRHLTALGRVQAKAIGDRLRWHDCTATHVWTSPLVRALQTAELLVGRFASDTGDILVEVMPDLAPGGSERDVVAAVRSLPPSAIIVLVGHEPGISAIGALLVGDPEFVALGKAQAVRIVDGKLRWRFAWDAEAPEPNGAPR